MEAADAAREAETRTQAAAEAYQIIRFRCGDAEFAISIDVVERTERVPMLTNVPLSPAFVCGIANLRGSVVCVIDLQALLDPGSEARGLAKAKSLLVLRLGEQRVGIVSAVLPDFRRVEAGEAILPPRGERDIFVGVLERAGDLIGLIDPNKLFELLERRLDGGS
ncbi:MAG: chemotaxis protein CheW [Planctomycetes bacterium]|nr:chemotaxis protein CheW [Planctomycetota bacterium]